MNAKERMRGRIEKHGRELLAIFPDALEQDPVKLCKKLRHLEREAAAIGLRLCNGPEYDTEDEPDRLCMILLAKMDKLLGNSPSLTKHGYVPVFVNRDPRGYALKIRSEWMDEHKPALHRDLGGYGILAPEFDGKP